MLLKEQWIREGLSSYYIVEKTTSVSYEKNILKNHSLECLLPCEFRMENGREYYCFETGIYTPLTEKIEEIEPRSFFYDFFSSMELAESYLLNLDHLKIQKDFIFLTKNQKPVFCYLPEYEENIFEQLRQFLEDCMEMISYEDKQKVRFYYEFHSFLVKEKPNMEQVKNYLKPQPKELKQLQLPEQEEEEQIKQEIIQPRKKKDMAFMILSALLFSIAIAIAISYAIRIFLFGFYYKFVLGFIIALGCFIGSLCYFCYKLSAKRSKVHDISVLQEEERTQLLEDDQKTELLMEDPLGYLIPKKEDEEKICISCDGFLIGSLLEGNDYILEKTGVSRRHLKFFLKDENVWIEDLDSTNGTKINGKKIKKHQLKEGDQIKIAKEEYLFTQTQD